MHVDYILRRFKTFYISILEQNSGGFLKFELVYNYKEQINDTSLIRKYKIKKY